MKDEGVLEKSDRIEKMWTYSRYAGRMTEFADCLDSGGTGMRKERKKDGTKVVYKSHKVLL